MKESRESDAGTKLKLSIPGLDIRLRQKIEDAGLFGAEVARRAGITPKRLNHYVNGTREPDVGTLRKICGVLEISIDELIDPDWELRHRDHQTYLAMRRFQSACQELTGDDVQFIAELAVFISERRVIEQRNYAEHLSPALRRLSRVHERLLPAILRTFSPVRLNTETMVRDDEYLWVLIDTEFKEIPNASQLERLTSSLIELARERLQLSENAIRPRISSPPIVTFEVRLGRPPNRM